MRVLLEEYRLKRNLTQAELSRRSGVPQAMISEIETGQVKAPRITTLWKLANALRVLVDDLVAADENDKKVV